MKLPDFSCSTQFTSCFINVVWSGVCYNHLKQPQKMEKPYSTSPRDKTCQSLRFIFPCNKVLIMVDPGVGSALVLLNVHIILLKANLFSSDFLKQNLTLTTLTRVTRSTFQFSPLRLITHKAARPKPPDDCHDSWVTWNSIVPNSPNGKCKCYAPKVEGLCNESTHSCA